MSKGRGGIKDASRLDWHALHEALIGIYLQIKFVFTGIYSFITSSPDEVFNFLWYGQVPYTSPDSV
jgi:hypothetical protein